MIMTKASVSISDVLEDVRTKHMPNTSPELYRYISPLGDLSSDRLLRK
jgi:hypothetical protein